MPNEDANVDEMKLLTTGELARRLGIQRYQLMYLLETGQVADATCRAGGRRLFTEREVERVKAAVHGRGARGP